MVKIKTVLKAIGAALIAILGIVAYLLGRRDGRAVDRRGSSADNPSFGEVESEANTTAAGIDGAADAISDAQETANDIGGTVDSIEGSGQQAIDGIDEALSILRKKRPPE